MPGARKIAAAVVTTALAAGAIGCGDNNEPTIPNDAARILLSDLQEIQANIDDGSCIVAGDRTQQFIDNVEALPSGVDEDVRRGLENGAEQLQILLADPDQCDGGTETDTEPTETQDTDTTDSTESITTETTPTEPTEPTTPTETFPPDTPGSPGGGGSGGVGPGGGQGGL